MQESTGYRNERELGCCQQTKVNASVKYIISQINLEQNKRGEMRWKPGSGQMELIQCHGDDITFDFLKILLASNFIAQQKQLCGSSSRLKPRWGECRGKKEVHSVKK